MELLQIIDAHRNFSPPFLQLIKRRKNARIQYVLKGFDPCQLTEKSRATLLHYAAAYGNDWLVQYLIGLGANVNALNSVRETPLMFAINNKHKSTVMLLLQANADIFAPDKHGKCALKKAFDNNMIYGKDLFWNFDMWKDVDDIVTSFQNRITYETLKSSRHVKNKAFHVDLPLYYFVKMKNAEVTRLLLENGSPVNAKEPMTEKTSLNHAVIEMDSENVQVLLEYGTDVNEKDFYSHTPLAHLFNFDDQNRAFDVFKVLMAAGASLIDKTDEQILVEGVLLLGNKQMINLLLKYPIDLHFMDHKGFTPLHYLSKNENPDVLSELRNFNFDVNIRAKNSNETMLHFAVKHLNSSSIRFLLDRNADINAMCKDGLTPLASLILFRLIDYIELDSCLDISIECIEMLLARGSDPRIVIEENNLCFIEVFTRLTSFSDNVIALLNPILTRLSIMDVSDQQIGKIMRTFIQSFSQFEHIFNKKKDECQEMKQVKLGQSVTLLDFLSATDKQISLYARERRLYSITSCVVKNYNLGRYYELKFQENFAKFNLLFELREKVATTLDEIIKEIYNTSVHNVAQKIVGYLEDQELNVFL